MSFQEKRNSKRLHLVETLPGTLGESRVRVLELGRIGALVDHEQPLAVGSTALLRFEAEGETLEIESEVMRSTMAGFPQQDDASNYQSGLRFITTHGDSEAALWRLIAALAKQMLMSQAANAMGVRLPGLSGSKHGFEAGETARRSRESGYICLSFELGVWERSQTVNSEQPFEGFTVAAAEDPEELENLCRLYESSDEEGRKTIRLLAELSVSQEKKSH
ncbi:MAG TPA: hypothetical protein VNM92_02685 [Thermoanaerobaculia bacterium]|nr:hypothetical protein [Thermoanaerobaculia bacterium]